MSNNREVGRDCVHGVSLDAFCGGCDWVEAQKLKSGGSGGHQVGTWYEDDAEEDGPATTLLRPGGVKVNGATFPTAMHKRAAELADLLTEKRKAYGNSFELTGDFFKLLYPHGIAPEQFADALCLARMFDKMKRIASGAYEDSYADLVGYGLLGDSLHRST